MPRGVGNLMLHALNGDHCLQQSDASVFYAQPHARDFETSTDAELVATSAGSLINSHRKSMSSFLVNGNAPDPAIVSAHKGTHGQERAAVAATWFTSPHTPSVRTGFHGGGDHDEGENSAEQALDNARSSLKVCLMALLASSAACLSAYVNYSLEKMHLEHEEAEARETRERASLDSPR
mmetsp:Transcript_82878/g.130315  ORF Transcript_82878/g.130315 Transcript_82878/m.130315 type:complete len:179 (+) Transcript_82878:80-616(+)